MAINSVDIMENLPKPKNQIQEVLYCLLTKKATTRKQFMKIGILNPTARIATLRNSYMINIKAKEIKVINKRNTPVKYADWHVLNRSFAIEEYLKMIKK